MSKEISDFETQYEIVGIKNTVSADDAGRPELPVMDRFFPKLPDKVDLSQYLHFIRKQGGLGCWGYSFLAIWDIMNEIVCPYSPNLSFRLWKNIFYKHNYWNEHEATYSPDGRFYDIKEGALNKGDPPFFTLFGCTTEGTDPSLHDYPARYGNMGWSIEGVNEAHNYRLESECIEIAVNSNDFMRWLADSHPIQINSEKHVVAVVGYDKDAEIFTILDSAGDKSGTGGYYTISFQDVDNKQNLWFLHQLPIINARILPKWNKIPPPKPVPVARIHIRHLDERGNIQLWLGTEDSPLPRNKIWSHGWKDNSNTLHYTVRLPVEFIWPPTHDNRIVLELYDSGIYSHNSGGEIIEFTAAFGEYVIESGCLKNESVHFKSHDRLIITIP